MTASHTMSESVLAESLVEIDKKKQEIGRLQGKVRMWCSIPAGELMFESFRRIQWTTWACTV